MNKKKTRWATIRCWWWITNRRFPILSAGSIGRAYASVALLASAAFGVMALMTIYTLVLQELSLARVGIIAGTLGALSNVAGAIANPLIGRYVDQTGNDQLVFVLLSLAPVACMGAVLMADKLSATDDLRTVSPRSEPLVTTDYMRQYLDRITASLEKIYAEQRERITDCATIVADHVANDGLLFVFGSGGHSNMMAEEMFHRAGGLACVSPVFVDSIRIPHVPLGERSAGIVPYIFDFYGIGEGSLLLLVNGYGINPVTIETMLEARKRGVRVIAVTSTDYAERLPKDFPGRHASGQNLHEMCEHVLLTYVPYGDAIVNVEGVESGVGAYSTYANAFICNSLVIEAARMLAERGITPPIINSINVLDGFQKNQALYARYRPRIRWL